MLPLPRRQIVHLRSSGFQGSRVFPANAKEMHLGDIPEIEADAPAVKSAIVPEFLAAVDRSRLSAVIAPGFMPTAHTRERHRLGSSPSASTCSRTSGKRSRGS